MIFSTPIGLTGREEIQDCGYAKHPSPVPVETPQQEFSGQVIATMTLTTHMNTMSFSMDYFTPQTNSAVEGKSEIAAT